MRKRLRGSNGGCQLKKTPDPFFPSLRFLRHAGFGGAAGETQHIVPTSAARVSRPPPSLFRAQSLLARTLGLSQAKPPVVGRDISGETRNPSGFSGSKRV